MGFGWATQLKPILFCFKRTEREEGEHTVERACPPSFQALVIPMAFAAVLYSEAWSPMLTWAAELEYEPDVILVMKDQAFHVVKGGAPEGDPPPPRFYLVAGEDIILMLRNEDYVAHEFVSPLFHRVEFRFSGEASIVYTHTATGVRVDPGETVTLRFELPEGSSDLFSFWCNVHGKLHGDPMRGEIFVLAPKKETSH